MGITGAWFTHKATQEAETAAGTLVFRGHGMEVSLAKANGLNSRILRDEDGDGTYEVTLVSDLHSGTTDLMPGDKIDFCDVVISFTVNANEDAWYIIKYNNKYYSAQGVEIEDADDLKKVSEIAGFASNAASLTYQGAADIVVPGAGTANSAQGTEYTNASIAALGAIEVRMVQTENLSQSAAYTYLTTGWDNPANYVAPAVQP